MEAALTLAPLPRVTTPGKELTPPNPRLEKEAPLRGKVIRVATRAGFPFPYPGTVTETALALPPLAPVVPMMPVPAAAGSREPPKATAAKPIVV